MPAAPGEGVAAQRGQQLALAVGQDLGAADARGVELQHAAVEQHQRQPQARRRARA